MVDFARLAESALAIETGIPLQFPENGIYEC
jgi:hypothetical protein